MNLTWARRATVIITDAVSWVVSISLSTFLVFGTELDSLKLQSILSFGISTVCFQIVVGLVIKRYQNRYWLASFEDVVSLALLTYVSAAFGVILVLLSCRTLVPPQISVVAPFIALFIMCTARAFWRILQERKHRGRPGAERVLLIGAGRNGEQLLHQLETDTSAPYQVVGFIDDSVYKKNLRIRGIKVLGNRTKFVAAARHLDVRTAIMAIPNASDETYQAYSMAASKAGIKLLTVPLVGRIIDEKMQGEIDLHNIRQLNVGDMLGRRQIQIDFEEVTKYITGRRVLVTGAGGSIGSELCRQVKALSPAELVLLDRDESALHAMDLELYGSGMLDTPNFALCDIRDREALRSIFDQHHPQVVFHAAALKHLPMLEQYPEEGWKTNVLGTRNVVELCTEFGVANLVNISTDKAAEPTTVLGRTKRTAERIVAYYSQKNANKGWRYVSVRFGNVLGSRGSVLWTFTSQIERGGPITITHPDVERFFMTIQEACSLVMQAGAIGRTGEVLVLDMGKPVKIIDVAKRMIEMSGKDIEIEITGLRPGEKLTEVLHFEGENDERPFHKLISHENVPTLEPEAVESVHSEVTKKDKLLYQI
ncbi:nucleoside-diphosphate sugar epimerase/dehydratase [uncultured Mobiluncus sp.]|uniref:polysaccharide biosynthesis protein n=1 Tax=uncultured Mobiluncus sp. TaxID=293425 RepID=UPI0026380B20|nr:nucleoside-diphosphate sugar epimerase/dehydratase [uncultured Mobiluncus sp.]